MKPKNGKGKPTAKLKKFYSIKQKIAVEKITEIIRAEGKLKPISFGEILRDAGYSDNYSKQPNTLMKSKSFQELLNHYLPDNDILEAHKGILSASKLEHYVFPAKESNKEIKETVESVANCKLQRISKIGDYKHAYYWIPDSQSQMKAISEAYKIKNKYSPEEHLHKHTLTDEQLNRIIKE